MLIRPKLWAVPDDAEAFAGSGVTEWERIIAQIGGVAQTTNALAATAAVATSVLLSTSADGVAPASTPQG